MFTPVLLCLFSGIAHAQDDIGTGGPAASLYRGPAFLPRFSIQGLASQSSQWETNGASVLGTLLAPRLPFYLDQDSRPEEPWGARTVQTNAYADPPDTGITRHYTFRITKQNITPDGVLKQGILANGAFPGPTIEANWGDWIEVQVFNDMSDEGTSLHWHGLLQTATPWMDGAPGVHQCPIPPGKSFTYLFKADLYGSSWWHSHFSSQYSDGLFGAMIIHGPRHAEYDVDLGPILLSDLYHKSYHEVEAQVTAPSFLIPNIPPSSNNNLINGKMNYPCIPGVQSNCKPNAGVSRFSFRTGQRYLLRLINSGSEGIQKFSIDSHTLTVIANDFVPVEPYDTTQVTLGVGQRTDVVVKATGNRLRSYWMRSTLGIPAVIGGCNVNDGISPTAVAAIYYEDARKDSEPTTTAIRFDSKCTNDALERSVPVFAMAVRQPTLTLELNVDLRSNGSHHLWYLNDDSYREYFSDPLYLEAKLGNKIFQRDRLTFDVGTNGSVRVVLYNHAITTAHPMHIHGHNMYVLQEGYGQWDGSIVRPSNPQRRDTHLMWNALPGVPSFMVFQFDLDNAGVWPIHCHIASHASTGLHFNILEKSELIKDAPVPLSFAQTCREWSTWNGVEPIASIDEGFST